MACCYCSCSELALGHFAQPKLGGRGSVGSAERSSGSGAPTAWGSELVRIKIHTWEVAGAALLLGGVCTWACHGVNSHPSPENGRTRCWVRPGQAGHSLTDLAVRVGEVATAVKMRIIAILQRSAAEPVGTEV